MNQYIEAHITFYSTTKIDVSGWTYSCIDGDPTLGKGVKSYLTRHFNKNTNIQDIIKEMDQISYFLHRQHSLLVIRKKVELVVYDERV